MGVVTQHIWGIPGLGLLSQKNLNYLLCWMLYAKSYSPIPASKLGLRTRSTLVPFSHHHVESNSWKRTVPPSGQAQTFFRVPDSVESLDMQWRLLFSDSCSLHKESDRGGPFSHTLKVNLILNAGVGLKYLLHKHLWSKCHWFNYFATGTRQQTALQVNCARGIEQPDTSLLYPNHLPRQALSRGKTEAAASGGRG